MKNHASQLQISFNLVCLIFLVVAGMFIYKDLLNESLGMSIFQGMETSPHANKLITISMGEMF
ncbi:MAG: hypothetical protein K2X66_06400 [Cyanobacteria bacterium]|nr:hypothetical protein [Cyanobacteriota bacterium]